jgi:hypothetical protein
MSSDATGTLGKVLAKCVADEAVSTRQLRAQPDSGTPVLRTGDGRRVLDDVDIAALIALGDIEELLRAAHQQRLMSDNYGYHGAVADHYMTHGHRLAFGCCLPRATAQTGDVLDHSPDAA